MRLLACLLLLLVACGDDGGSVVGPDRNGTDPVDTDGRGGRDAETDLGTADSGDAEDGEDAGADAAVDAPTQDSSGGDTGSADTAPDVHRDTNPVDIDNECVEVAYVAEEAYRAADIIWVIDTSESMDDEIALVRANINNFVGRIDESGVDTRVVMVASKEDRTINIEVPFIPFPVPQSYHGVCVPPPLSLMPGCPDTDNFPFFLHPDVDVYSTDALTRLMEDAYPQFRRILRPHARTHIVVVTDDSSEKSPEWFRDQTRLVDPPGFSVDYVFHSIIARSGDSCGDGAGSDYEVLSFETGGVVQSICLSDWTPIFNALLEGVVSDAVIPCAFGMPEPEEGLVINPNEVNVYLTPPGGEAELVRNVENSSGCTDEGGWYYDDPFDPTAVFICPAICGDGVNGTIDIAFGCETIKE